MGLDKSESMVYNRDSKERKEDRERLREALKVLGKEFFDDNSARVYSAYDLVRRNTDAA